MRRVIPVVVLLVAGACAAEPPERSPLPDVAEAVPEPAGCMFNVGEPQGVTVVTVIDPSAAAGVLREGDVITSVGGAHTETRPDLTAAMLDYAPGDSVDLTFVRDGDPETVSLVLGANPDEPARALIGITVETAFDQIPPEEATGVVQPSPTTRPIQVAGTIYLLDPLLNAWQQTGVEAPTETRWVATSSGFYTTTESEPFAVLDLTTDSPVEDDGFRDWDLQRVIGRVGDTLIVFLTVPTPEQPGLVNLAVGGFDPVSGTTEWVTPLSAATFGVPNAAFGSPDGTAFVALGISPETGEILGIDLFDAEGVQQNRDGLVELGAPIGWFDERSVAFRTNEDTVSTFDFVDGATEMYQLPESLADAITATVADGRNILAVGGQDLQMQDLTDPNVSVPLASDCTIGQTGEPGWGV